MISWLRKLIQSGDQVSVSPKKIIVGLGNPGLRYVRTLHNAGFLTVDRIAGEDVKWKKWRNLASICIIEVEGVRVFLVKPSTYMNLSGKAVQPLPITVSPSRKVKG
jgi:PTH1 family peptidyl-tRNA hydrolase